MIDDRAMMQRALALAQGALGKVAPNPAVGCVIVKDDAVIAEAATGAGGRPHAEEAALAQLGGRADGATAFVTLEPCAHVSARGPACAPNLVQSGVTRCIIACEDPDPRTAGAGIQMLRGAGVEVELGLCGVDARTLNAGFFKLLRTGRPLVVADADASTYDGKFLLGPHESFEEALDRMGREGLTRVRVAPGSPQEAALKSRNLLD